MKDTTFKDRLIDELNYKGISNREFAERVGISTGTLGMYLYRGSIPSADIAVKMANVLNTSVEYLVLGTENGKKTLSLSSKDQWQRREITNIVNSMTEEQLKHFLVIAREFKSALS